MGGKGGDEYRLIQSRKLRKRRDWQYGYQTLYSYCVTVVFHFFGFIPLVYNVDPRVISHNILIQSLFSQEGAQICFQTEYWVSCKAQQSLPRYDFFLHLSINFNTKNIAGRQMLKISDLSATLSNSVPLDFPSEKSFLSFLAHEKGLGYMFQKQLSCSPVLFFTSPQVKNDFWPAIHVDSDRKCKFQRFCPARSDCNNVAHGMLS